jgi:hypothetical protein
MNTPFFHFQSLICIFILENQLESDDEEETKKVEEKKKQEADKWNESKEDPEKIRLAKEAEKKKNEEARQAEARVKNKNA